MGFASPRVYSKLDGCEGGGGTWQSVRRTTIFSLTVLAYSIALFLNHDEDPAFQRCYSTTRRKRAQVHKTALRPYSFTHQALENRCQTYGSQSAPLSSFKLAQYNTIRCQNSGVNETVLVRGACPLTSRGMSRTPR